METDYNGRLVRFVKVLPQAKTCYRFCLAKPDNTVQHMKNIALPALLFRAVCRMLEQNGEGEVKSKKDCKTNTPYTQQKTFARLGVQYRGRERGGGEKEKKVILKIS